MWFRRDLRLSGNPAWCAATQQGDEVTALFVLDPRLFERAGRYRQAVLVSHLRALDTQLRERGGALRVEAGDPTQLVPAVAAELHADVHWNTDTTPYAVRRDHAVIERLPGAHSTHWGLLVHEPGHVLTGKGTLSKVFTPFYKVWNGTAMTPWVEGEGGASIASAVGGFGGTAQLPEIDASSDTPLPLGGEDGANARLLRFNEQVDDYLETRDLPAVDGTSQLSADLRFGTLSPRHVAAVIGESTPGRAGFVRQLAWRDWYAHLLLENPTMPSSAIKPEYDSVRWIDDTAGFEAWTTGTTGFPIVDAGMRQLQRTGWMHNRVRMIVGSFLVKDLLIDWRKGERWFRHLLVDADVSQNVGNWQWVAGCGTDAAPYFRVFNPWTQSRKFDASGDYIRRWVPELGGLDDKAIHEPAAAAPLDLAAAGVVLGDTYPHPIVDHSFARDRALTAYKSALGKP